MGAWINLRRAIRNRDVLRATEQDKVVARGGQLSPYSAACSSTAKKMVDQVQWLKRTGHVDIAIIKAEPRPLPQHRSNNRLDDWIGK